MGRLKLAFRDRAGVTGEEPTSGRSRRTLVHMEHSLVLLCTLLLSYDGRRPARQVYVSGLGDSQAGRLELFAITKAPADRGRLDGAERGGGVYLSLYVILSAYAY